jgi:hypothetical protein
MLGLMLLGALAFGSYAAAMASAEEPGLLPELGAKSSTVELHFLEAKNPKIATAAGEIKCASVDLVKAAATGSHIDLFNEVDVMFLGCEQLKGESKLKCRSENLKAEKDPEGTILVLADYHLVDLLNSTFLAPGIVLIILDPNTKSLGSVKVKCGVGNIELKGALKGLLLVAGLTLDVKLFTIDYPTSFKCDTNDTLCLKYEEKGLEFLANIGGTFEPATTTMQLEVHTNVEVLSDD